VGIFRPVPPDVCHSGAIAQTNLMVQFYSGTKAGGFENRPPLSSKSRVHLLIYTPHALKSLKSDINLILLKLKYLDSDTSALFNLYL
jgi:hypothetical protein